MDKTIYSKSALVKVATKYKKGKKDSESGLAYVLDFNKSNQMVNILYTVTGILSQEIKEDRILARRLKRTGYL